MLEIIVKNLETKEEDVVKCEECVVIGITPAGEGEQESKIVFKSSIDHVAMAIADCGMVRAAARIGVAYHDGKRDALEEKRESVHKMIESIEDEIRGLIDND